MSCTFVPIGASQPGRQRGPEHAAKERKPLRRASSYKGNVYKTGSIKAILVMQKEPVRVTLGRPGYKT